MVVRILGIAALAGAFVLAAAPVDQAVASGPGGGAGGGGGQVTCQIRQLSDSPTLLTTAAAIDSTYVVAGCPAATWSLSYQNTALGTLDFSASGPVGGTGVRQATVEAAPLLWNYPYRVTLTVTGPSGAVLTSRTDTVFTPKPRD